MRDLKNRTMIAIIFVVVGMGLDALAQEKDATIPLDTAQLKRWTEFYQQEAAEYEISLGHDGATQLDFQSVPIFRWAAPITQNEFNGVIYVWTHQGRPEVLGSIWSVASKQLPGKRNIAHTFHSLSLQPVLANRNGKAFWHPESPGIKLKPVPDAPEPAATAVQRRLQIRAIAQEFSAVQEVSKTRSEPLKMLPRPILEFETESSSGAIFTFLRDWDPEVMLLIESRETPNGTRWHFEPLRFCMLGARVVHKGVEVWRYQRGGSMRDPEHYYFSMHGASIVDRIIPDP